MAPQITALQWRAPNIHVEWRYVSYASSYHFEVYPPGEEDTPAFSGTKSISEDSPLSFDYPLPAGAAAGSWLVRVRAAHASQDGPWSSKPIVKLATPSPTLGLQGESLVLAWPAVSGASGYDASITTPTGRVAATGPVPKDDPQLTASMESPEAGPYVGAVRALAPDATWIPGDESSPIDADVLTLATLNAVSLRYEGDALIAAWTGAPGGLTVDVRLLEGGDERARASTTAGELTLSPTPSPAEGQGFVARARLRSPSAIGPWLDSAEIRVHALPAPAAPALRYDGALSIEWSAPEGAPEGAQYEIELNLNGAPLASPLAATASPQVLTPAGLADDQVYSARLRAHEDGSVGPWSAASAPITVHTLVAPQQLQVAFDGEELIMGWALTDGASAPDEQSEFRVRIQQGTATPQVRAVGAVLTARLSANADGLNLAANLPVSVEVQETRGGSVGPWSDPAQTVQPGSPTLSVENQILVVGFVPLPLASSLSPALSDAASGALNPEPTFTVGERTAEVSGDALTEGLDLRVVIVAKVTGQPDSRGLPATLTLHFLGDPSPVEVEAVDDQLRASWTVVPEGTTEASLRDAQGTILLQQRPATSPWTPDLSAVAVGTELVVRVRAEADASASSAESAQLTWLRLAAPAAPSAQNVGGTVLVSWTPTQGSESTELVVLDAQGVALDPQPVIAASEDFANVVASSLTIGSTYGFALTAHAEHQRSARSGITTLVRAFIASPTDLHLTLDQALNEVRLQYSAPGASSVELQVLQGTEALRPPLPWTMTLTSATAPSSSLVDGQSYRFTATAVLDVNTRSRASNLDFTVRMLAAPGQTTLVLSGHRAVLRWTAVEGADSYALELTVDGRAPDASVSVQQDGLSATVDGPNLLAGQVLAMRVRGQADDSDASVVLGPWCDLARVTWTNASVEEVAQQLFNDGASVVEAAVALRNDFDPGPAEEREASPAQIAAAMVLAGYKAKDSLLALSRTYGKALSPAEAAAAIEAVFDTALLVRLNARRLGGGASVGDAESGALAQFPDITPAALASTTIIAGASAVEALRSLILAQVFGPNFRSELATAAILAAFSPETVAARAARDRAGGASTSDEAATLARAFTPPLQAAALQEAMLAAGYPEAEVALAFTS